MQQFIYFSKFVFLNIRCDRLIAILNYLSFIIIGNTIVFSLRITDNFHKYLSILNLTLDYT